MSPTIFVESACRRPSSTHKLFLRLGTILAFLCMFPVLPALGQTDYSDSWIDDSNPDAGYIVGAGVTDDDYSADAISVETTLTSPNGRTVTAAADDYGSVRVEVALPWDWNDFGDYFVRTRHQPLCWGNWDGSMLYERRSGGTMVWYWNPNYYRCLEGRTTNNSFDVGISHAVYEAGQCQPDGCAYVIMPNCNTSCKSQTIKVKNPSMCHYYAIRNTVFHQSFIGSKICLNLTATTEVSDNPGLCWDESYVP